MPIRSNFLFPRWRNCGPTKTCGVIRVYFSNGIPVIIVTPLTLNQINVVFTPCVNSRLITIRSAFNGRANAFRTIFIIVMEHTTFGKRTQTRFQVKNRYIQWTVCSRKMKQTAARQPVCNREINLLLIYINMESWLLVT